VQIPNIACEHSCMSQSLFLCFWQLQPYCPPPIVSVDRIHVLADRGQFLVPLYPVQTHSCSGPAKVLMDFVFIFVL
jgi:hypothetical protein